MLLGKPELLHESLGTSHTTRPVTWGCAVCWKALRRKWCLSGSERKEGPQEEHEDFSRQKEKPEQRWNGMIWECPRGLPVTSKPPEVRKWGSICRGFARTATSDTRRLQQMKSAASIFSPDPKPSGSETPLAFLLSPCFFCQIMVVSTSNLSSMQKTTEFHQWEDQSTALSPWWWCCLVSLVKELPRMEVYTQNSRAWWLNKCLGHASNTSSFCYLPFGYFTICWHLGTPWAVGSHLWSYCYSFGGKSDNRV